MLWHDMMHGLGDFTIAVACGVVGCGGSCVRLLSIHLGSQPPWAGSRSVSGRVMGWCVYLIIYIYTFPVVSSFVVVPI